MNAACKVIDLLAFQRREMDASTGGGDPPHEVLLLFLAGAWAFAEASSADARKGLATYSEIAGKALNEAERAQLDRVLTWSRGCTARFLTGDEEGAPDL